ncbi:MAG: hypothetical protein Q9170_005587 [Blastenia crenularia]
MDLLPQMHLSLFAVYKQLIIDSRLFVDSADEEIAKLVYEGRRSPETEKLYHLLHLGDCCRLSASGLAHAASLLKETLAQTWLDGSPDQVHDAALRAWFDSALQDIDTLRGHLADLELQVVATRSMIKDQLDLRNGRRTGLIGLLAAIYIPFAFMSSLFGMNIKDPIWGPIVPSGLEGNTSENLTSPTTNLTTIAQNQTNAIVSAISSSGGYLWSFKMYWTVTAPVTIATILLPLIAGPTTRYLVKFSYRNRAYSRILLSSLGVAGEVLLALFSPVLVYLIIFGFVYGALALGMLCWASMRGRSPWLWIIFAAVFAYSLILDLTIARLNAVSITGSVPLVFLILILFRSDIRRLLPGKIRKPVIAITARLLITFRTHRRARQVFVIRLYYVLAFLDLWYNYDPDFTVLLVPMCILAINRLVHSFSQKEKLIDWLFYVFLLLLTSIVTQYAGWLLFYLLPMTYVFVRWIYHEYQAFFDKIHRQFTTRWHRQRFGRVQNSTEAA